MGLLALLICLLPAAPGSGAANAEIVRVELDPRPGWAISGVWTAGGRELLIVDAFRSEVLRYSSAGEFLSEVKVPYRGSMEMSRPSVIHPWGDGFLVEQEDADFVTLGADLTALAEVDLLELGRRPEASIASVFSWTPAADSLVTLSDVRLPGGRWSTSLLRVPFDNPADFQVLYRLDGDPRALEFYLLGQQYLTTLGGKVYFLMMSAHPTIYEVSFGNPGDDPSLRTLEAFPANFLHRPLLPEQAELEQLSALFEGVQRSRMAAGLYAWNDDLYVLTRRPSSVSGEVAWALTRIDPRKDEVVETLPLPTTTAHVTVIPGPEAWAVLEKGPVSAFGQQQIPSFLLIPSSAFSR